MCKRKVLALLVASSVMSSLIAIPQANAANSVSVDINTKYQTLEGFGAAIAWYGDFIVGHPNKNELYQTLFSDSGIDILRIRNVYRNSPNFDNSEAEIVKTAKTINPGLKVFLCSWSPPSDLKKDGVMNGGTLAKVNGSYVYDKFGDYWYNSLKEYRAKGIIPDYISIQNEPDYQNTGWETCVLKPTEDSNYASYGKALDAVYNKIKTLPNVPKILGPELAGIANNNLQNYVKGGLDLTKVYGIAHHLYENSGDANSPDTFNPVFKTLAATYPDKPFFQTEFDYGTPFTTAQLIYNSLVNENASAYLYWDLIWNSIDRPLVYVESPNNRGSWTTPKGYKTSDFFPIIQQYAKFTDPGYKRVAAVSPSDNIKVTAFVSPDSKKLTMIFVNTASSENTVSLNLKGYSVNDSEIYRTLSNGSEKFANVGSLKDNTVTLPAQSVVTVAMGITGGSPGKLVGDLNKDGRVDIFDATLLKSYVLKKISIDRIDATVADMNNDKEINALDYLLIKRQIAARES